MMFLRVQLSSETKLRKLRYITFLLLFCIKVNGQSTIYELPVFFSQYFNDPQIISKNLSSDEKAHIQFGHRKSTNNFGGLNTSVASGKIKINASNGENFNEVGLLFTNDEEGFLISRNKAYLSYGYNLKISPQFFLGGGLNFGFYNFSVDALETFEGISNNTHDGGFNIKLFSENFNAQFNLNQAFNSEVKHINQVNILARNYNLFIESNFVLDKNVNFKPSILARYSKPTSNIYSGLNLTYGTQLLLANRVLIGASLEPKNGFNYYAGIEKIKVSNTFFGVEFSYFSPISSGNRTNLNFYEIMIYCLINSKKNN